MQYYQVLISAEQTAQANKIMDALMAKQLILGGPVIGGPARFLWNFQDSAVPESLRESKLLTVDQDYTYIVTYTREDLKQELIEVAELASLEEVCMISMMPMEANASLIKLLDATFAGRETAAAAPQPVEAVAALTFVPDADIPFRTKFSS